MKPETPFEELKRYVRFDEADARRLHAFHRVVSPHFQDIAKQFSLRISEHHNANAILSGEDQLARLTQSLIAWMHRLFQGPYDQHHYEQTLGIGDAHVRFGVPQRYVVVAMSPIRLAFDQLAERHAGRDAAPLRRAIHRLLDVELAVILERYQLAELARLETISETQRGELHRRLQRAEHRYANAVELARVLIIGLDPSGAIRLFNREAERVSGFARDEVTGAPFIETLIQEDLRDSHGAIVRDVLAGKRVGVDALVSSVRTRSGKYRDVRWQLAFAPPTTGTTSVDDIVLFAVGQDITEENARLERAKHTEKLATVGTLAAGLAHEIRNPLNGAQLHLAFLERALGRSGADTEVLDAVSVIADEVRRLASLVTEFLDFARPRPLTLRPVRLAERIERAGQLVAPQAKAAAVTFDTDLPDAPLEVDADPAKLLQVLLNVLANAIEALAPMGGGRVLVRARRFPRTVCIEIEDDGPGLRNPDAPIFDPFFSTKPHGTGLGLAITHRIVADHGGTITVDSRPGRTVFRITLPVRSDHAANPLTAL
jgi:PAS domain S-box-containing protein